LQAAENLAKVFAQVLARRTCVFIWTGNTARPR
jgi:hypothetical protein